MFIRIRQAGLWHELIQRKSFWKAQVTPNRIHSTATNTAFWIMWSMCSPSSIRLAMALVGKDSTRSSMEMKWLHLVNKLIKLRLCCQHALRPYLRSTTNRGGTITLPKLSHPKASLESRGNFDCCHQRYQIQTTRHFPRPPIGSCIPGRRWHHNSLNPARCECVVNLHVQQGDTTG